jgi:hypothetical protein
LIRKTRENISSKPVYQGSAKFPKRFALICSAPQISTGLEINAFKKYPIEIVRRYFDLIYGVNASELSSIEIIQIIDLLFDCGYTDKYESPWQFRKSS